MEGKNNRAPIDSGYAWLVACYSMCIWMVSSVCMIGFSVYYVEFLDKFQAGESVTSAIFAVYMITYSVSGPLSGEIIRALGFRINGSIGCTLGCLGLLICCVTDDVIFIFIGYGVCVGAGASFMQITAMVSTQMYFCRWRSVAMGLAGVGVSISGFVVPLLVRFLVDTFSLKGSLLIVAGVFIQAMPFVCLLRPIPNKVTETVVPPQVEGDQENTTNLKSAPGVFCRVLLFLKKVFDISLLKRPKVALYYLGMFCTNMYTTTVYSFTVARGISNGETKLEAAVSMTVFGATNLLGRLLISWLGDRTSRFACFCVCVLLTGVAAILSTVYFSHTVYVVFCGFTGFTVGGYIILAITTAVDLVGMDQVSKINGLISLFFGIAGLLAMSVGGRIVELTGSYDVIFLVMGIVILFGGTVLTSLAISLRILRMRKEGKMTKQKQQPNGQTLYSPVPPSELTV